MKDTTKKTTKKKAKIAKAIDVTILKSEKKPKPKKEKRVFKGKVLKTESIKRRVVSHKVYTGSFFATEA